MLLLAAYMLCCGNGDMGISPWPQQPPPQYVHPYHGHLTVKYGTQADIHMWCHSYFAGACAMVGRNSCTIMLPAPTPGGSPELAAAYRNHEIGHCNGWVHR